MKLYCNEFQYIIQIKNYLITTLLNILYFINKKIFINSKKPHKILVKTLLVN